MVECPMKSKTSLVTSENRVYADYNATTPISENVIKNILSALSLKVLNPSSMHQDGQKARKIIQDARENVYKFLGASNNKEIIFTSSATEANNLAIMGMKGYKHIISAIEHHSVLRSVSNPYIIPVNRDGVIEITELEKALHMLKGEKVLVSIMMANNETGVIQPVKKIAKIVHEFGAIYHTDAAQGIGKIDVNIEELGVDLLTLSAHKFGGIAGSGVLIFRKDLKIDPIIHGGKQEKGLRAGTENVVAIAGLSSALCDIPRLLSKVKEIEMLRNKLEHEILNLVKDVGIFGKDSNRLSNTSCIYMPKVKSDVQLMSFDLSSISIGNGSACSSGKIEPSHVLQAMGATREQMECSIRISIGYNTTFQDIEKIINCWYSIYRKNLI